VDDVEAGQRPASLDTDQRMRGTALHQLHDFGQWFEEALDGFEAQPLQDAKLGMTDLAETEGY
jgi:hypothetical protein